MCYFHIVFSVPHALVPLMWQNKKILFNLLFETSAATLLEVAADPRHLGAEIGSSVFCIRGGRLCSAIRTFTVSYPAADCRRTMDGGSAHLPTSSSP